MESSAVESQVHKGIKWVTISAAFNHGSRTITYFILAHLLEREMFGLMTMAAVCIELIGMLRRIGFGTAYIQRQDDEPGASALAANTTFWLIAAINVVLFVGASLLTPFIASFFRTDGLEPVLRFVFVTFLLDAVSTVPNTDLQKRLEFKKQAICEMAQGLSFPLISIILAAHGAGVWSLVFGMLGSRLVFTLTVLISAAWWPRFQFSLSVAGELFNFGKYIWGHVVLTTVASALDKAIIGRLYGPLSLGVYFMAFKLCDLPATQINNIVNKVSLPAFSKIRKDPDRLRQGFLKTLTHLSAVTLPLCLGLLALSEQLPTALLGEKWRPMVPMVNVLVIYALSQGLSSLTGPLFMAAGRPNVLLIVSTMQCLFKIGLIIALMGFGELGICYAVSISWFLFSIVIFVLTIKQLDLALRDLLEAIVPPALAAVFMLLVIKLLESLLVGNIDCPAGVLFSGFVVLGIVSYAAASLVLNRRAFIDLLATAYSILRGGKSAATH